MNGYQKLGMAVVSGALSLAFNCGQYLYKLLF